MQEKLGGADAYRSAYLEKLQEVFDAGEDLTVHAAKTEVTKTGDGTRAEGRRVLEQKQEGLYTVIWHPIGGQARVEDLCVLSDTIADMDEVEMRLSADETAYIINLTGAEAEKVLAVTEDTAQSLFETSVSCIGASTCQVGVRDSQALLQACVRAVRAAGLPDGALPQIHISGCPSSCGTHQIGALGFRGGAKKSDGETQSAFVLYVHGNDRQGEESMGTEYGTILENRIPEFLVKLGKTVAETGMTYAQWILTDPDGVRAAAEEYL